VTEEKRRSQMYEDEDGFLRVAIRRDDGQWASRLVHEQVAEAWVPNPGGCTKVRHKDGDRRNNASRNLEWY
jgi:hypothetical protein